jgi:hypothetical protein
VYNVTHPEDGGLGHELFSAMAMGIPVALLDEIVLCDQDRARQQWLCL